MTPMTIEDADSVLRTAARVWRPAYRYKGEVASAMYAIDWQDEAVRLAEWSLRQHHTASDGVYFGICQRYGFQHPIQRERAHQVIARRLRRAEGTS